MARQARRASKRKAAAEAKRAGRPRAAGDGGRPLRWYWRYSVAVVLVGAAALAWMSVLSYSPADPPLLARLDANGPATGPASQPTTAATMEVVLPVPLAAGDANVAAPRMRLDLPEAAPAAQPARPATQPAVEVANAAGIVGAYTAHGLLHYVGAGSVVGLAFVSAGALVLALRGRIRALPLRLAGMLLLVAAVSSAAWLSHESACGVTIGPAGRLGAAGGAWLESQFAISGGWVVVTVATVVGLLMTAERLLLVPLRLAHRAWGALWKAVAAARERAAARREAKAADKAAQAAAMPAPAAAAAPVAQPTAEDRSRVIEQITRRLREFAERAASAPPPAPPAPADEPGLDESFALPSIDLLAAPAAGGNEAEADEAARRRDVLQRTLGEFGVEAEVVAHEVGPVITMFELALAAGVKVSQVAKLDADLARALAVPDVRIVSPLPGRDTIGVEVPNRRQQTVRVRELMDAAGGQGEKAPALPVYLGRDAAGGPIVLDLASAPHVLIAGTTGSGKSVCLNSILVSLMMTRRPAEVRFVLVDPKRVEMALYEGAAHLLCPPVSDMQRAKDILAWAAERMDRRYAVLRDAGVRQIGEFNRLPAEARAEKVGSPDRMPYVVILVDELADLMMTSGKEVEAHIIRIAQKARAVGIHLVLATQRPSVDVVTGLIKSNMPCRMSFRVASRVESRIILDQNGAEVLLGRGDMLLLRPGTSTPVRAQGTFLLDAEIRAVVADIRKRSGPCYDPELVAPETPPQAAPRPGGLDELFDRAVEAVLAEGRGSASQLQRELSVPYARARAILDELTDVGVLGPHQGSQPRDARITPDDWRRVRAAVPKG